MKSKPQIEHWEDRGLIVESISHLIGKGLPGRVIIVREATDDLQNLRINYGLTIPVEGRWYCAGPVRGEVEEMRLEPGDAILTPPDSWTIERVGPERAKLGFSIGREHVYCHRTWHRREVRKAHRLAWFSSSYPLNETGMSLLRGLEALASEPQHQPTAKLMVLALLHEVRRHFERTPERQIGHSKSFATYRSIQNFVHQNFTLPIGREHVARQFQLHPNHISRIFREHAEESFHVYLTRLRMERAARLVRRRILSMDEIAQACGYGDTPNFRKAFRNFYGVTPGRFT